MPRIKVEVEVRFVAEELPAERQNVNGPNGVMYYSRKHWFSLHHGFEVWPPPVWWAPLLTDADVQRARAKRASDTKMLAELAKSLGEEPSKKWE